MLKKIKDLIWPMSSKVSNETHDKYEVINALSLGVFLLLMKILALFVDEASVFGLLKSLGIPLALPTATIHDLLGLLSDIIGGATAYGIIRCIVSAIYQHWWISRNRSDCYIQGTWYYVFDRKYDRDKDYVRAGYLTVNQNFFDVDISACNCNVRINNTEIELDPSSLSYWKFEIGEIDKNGVTRGYFSKNNPNREFISNQGVMEFQIPPLSGGRNQRKVTKMIGLFSDAGDSTIEGRMFLYKAKKKVDDSLQRFVENAPAEWKEQINIEYSYKGVYSFLEGVVRSAAKKITDNNQPLLIKEKNGNRNIVTEFDLEIEKYIHDEIKKKYPEARFLGEEKLKSDQIAQGLLFIIDPIDGTTNYVNDCRFSCISVAMVKDGITCEAVVYNPYAKELFYAKKSEGAYLNGKKVTIKDSDLKDSIVGFSNCPYDLDILDNNFEFGKKLFKNANDIRRMGSSALEICYSGIGRYQLYCEMILYPWDYVGPALFVKEAGGVVTDLDGNELQLDKRCSIASGCPSAHKELLQLFKEYKEESGYSGPINTTLL